MKISLIKLLEDEAKECERLAIMDTLTRSEVYYVLARSYYSLAKRCRDAATPYKIKETNAGKD